MKRIYTSYFSKFKIVPTPISIARANPHWCQIPQMLEIAPSLILLYNYKQRITNPDEYTRIYQYDVLDRLNPQIVYNSLPDVCTLLCWEPPGQFCHRHLVAQWLRENLGVNVEEWL